MSLHLLTPGAGVCWGGGDDIIMDIVSMKYPSCGREESCGTRQDVSAATRITRAIICANHKPPT